MRHASAFVLGAVALAACDAPRPAQPQLWTLFDVQQLYADGAPDAIATDAGLPGGVPLSSMLDPNAPHTALTIAPGWAEGYPVGYATTEVWTRFDEVWAQPVYIPVTGWSGGMPQNQSPHPIFSVGPNSLFYSPYWQMIYVEVPDGQAKSAREILDGKYPLHPSRGWMAALTPQDVGLGAQPAMPTPGTPAMGTGWLDGASIPFVKFPAASVGIGADAVVEEVPIFHFVFVKDDGTWAAPAIPTVLGTGPLYSNTLPPTDAAGVPTGAYSAYWRVYVVVVPFTARVFAPPGSPTAQALDDEAVPSVAATMYGDILSTATEAELNERYGRVVLDEKCLTTVADSKPGFGGCRYLDSQLAIEAAVPKNLIVRTDVTVTCPLVTVKGNTVP